MRTYPKCPKKNAQKRVEREYYILRNFFRKCFFQRKDTGKLLSVDHIFGKASVVEETTEAAEYSGKNQEKMWEHL